MPDDHVVHNRAIWDDRFSQWFGSRAAQQWAAEPHWGIWATPESELLPDDSFDVAISEYGASSWCEPALWIPEAARLLRPGGQLIFLRNSTLLELCTARDAEVAGERLSRPYADVARIDRPDGGTHFQLPTGPMIKLLRESGFVIDELTEYVVPADAQSDYDYVTPEWASTWPSLELWKARLWPRSSYR